MKRASMKREATAVLMKRRSHQQEEEEEEAISMKGKKERDEDEGVKWEVELRSEAAPSCLKGREEENAVGGQEEG